MSKVLVTGGAGFIGSHVVDLLIAQGYEVAVVDSLVHGRRDQVHLKATFYEADIRDMKALERIFAVERPDYISHHAALANVRESLDAPLDYAAVNILGGLNLLQLARRYAVRKFIYANTGGAGYGEGRGKAPFDESQPVQPQDPYGASKIAFESYLHVYQHNFGLDYVSLRYANVYGPRQDPFGEGGVVAIFSRRMIEGQPCTIYGTGEKTRDFVYVGDVARANLLALTRGSGVCNVSTGAYTDINTVFQALRAVCPGCSHEPAYAADRPGEVWDSALSPERAGQMLGWEPETNLADGLARTVEFFRQRA